MAPIPKKTSRFHTLARESPSRFVSSPAMPCTCTRIRSSLRKKRLRTHPVRVRFFKFYRVGCVRDASAAVSPCASTASGAIGAWAGSTNKVEVAFGVQPSGGPEERSNNFLNKKWWSVRALDFHRRQLLAWVVRAWRGYGAGMARGWPVTPGEGTRTLLWRRQPRAAAAQGGGSPGRRQPRAAAALGGGSPGRRQPWPRGPWSFEATAAARDLPEPQDSPGVRFRRRWPVAIDARLWKDRNPIFPGTCWTTLGPSGSATGQHRRNRALGDSGVPCRRPGLKAPGTCATSDTGWGGGERRRARC
eukprot:gene23816-biopygen23855